MYSALCWGHDGVEVGSDGDVGRSRSCESAKFPHTRLTACVAVQLIDALEFSMHLNHADHLSGKADARRTIGLVRVWLNSPQSSLARHTTGSKRRRNDEYEGGWAAQEQEEVRRCRGRDKPGHQSDDDDGMRTPTRGEDGNGGTGH